MFLTLDMIMMLLNAWEALPDWARFIAKGVGVIGICCMAACLFGVAYLELLP